MEPRRGVVLVVEDEQHIRDMLVEFLRGEGHTVHAAERGREGAGLALSLRPDLVILDVQMPDMDGLEVCRLLKDGKRTRSIPIMILTSSASLSTRLKALECSADHFLAKPVADWAEFAQWVQALLSRSGSAEIPGRRTLLGGLLTLDAEACSATMRGASPVPLPAKLFALLSELAERPGEALSREFLLDRVWGSAVRDRHVDVAVSRLRALLGAPAEGLIASVPGVGYRLEINSGK